MSESTFGCLLASGKGQSGRQWLQHQADSIVRHSDREQAEESPTVKEGHTKVLTRTLRGCTLQLSPWNAHRSMCNIHDLVLGGAPGLGSSHYACFTLSSINFLSTASASGSSSERRILFIWNKKKPAPSSITSRAYVYINCIYTHAWPDSKQAHNARGRDVD